MILVKYCSCVAIWHVKVHNTRGMWKPGCRYDSTRLVVSMAVSQLVTYNWLGKVPSSALVVPYSEQILTAAGTPLDLFRRAQNLLVLIQARQKGGLFHYKHYQIMTVIINCASHSPEDLSFWHPALLSVTFCLYSPSRGWWRISSKSCPNQTLHPPKDDDVILTNFGGSQPTGYGYGTIVKKTAMVEPTLESIASQACSVRFGAVVLATCFERKLN